MNQYRGKTYTGSEPGGLATMSVGDFEKLVGGVITKALHERFPLDGDADGKSKKPKGVKDDGVEGDARAVDDLDESAEGDDYSTRLGELGDGPRSKSRKQSRGGDLESATRAYMATHSVGYARAQTEVVQLARERGQAYQHTPAPTVATSEQAALDKQRAGLHLDAEIQAHCRRHSCNYVTAARAVAKAHRS